MFTCDEKVQNSFTLLLPHYMIIVLIVYSKEITFWHQFGYTKRQILQLFSVDIHVFCIKIYLYKSIFITFAWMQRVDNTNSNKFSCFALFLCISKATTTMTKTKLQQKPHLKDKTQLKHKQISVFFSILSLFWRK